jgi:hypothetical protein
MRSLTAFPPIALALATLSWSNGPAGNATTNLVSECSDPPYGTHDWIADHAQALLPDSEAGGIRPHRTMFLLGTEAPDNDAIPVECGAPNTGYDDRRRGHSVNWNRAADEMIEDRAASRALQEYDKAVDAFADGDSSATAFYLGAMAHYIGDVSQYGHTCRCEEHHGDYEDWAKRRTDSFEEGVFERYIQPDNLVRRRPFTAVRRVSLAVAQGQGALLSAEEMDAHWSNKDQAYIDSVGEALNVVVNELADVLHRFWLNEVR